MQASLKTIGEEDKYFSKVSLRLESMCTIVLHFDMQCKLSLVLASYWAAVSYLP